jgi:hypothetical protein
MKDFTTEGREHAEKSMVSSCRSVSSAPLCGEFFRRLFRLS